MDNLVKAKVIIELLDDTKYSVLSSLSSSEMDKINNVSIDKLNEVSKDDIKSTLKDFIQVVKENSTKEKEPVPQPVKAAPASTKDDKSVTNTDSLDQMLDKLHDQPIQIIACMVNRLEEQDKEYLISKFSEDRQAELMMVDVENVPISAEVIDVIIKELDLKI